MVSERMRELLKNAARCFEQNYNPFCHTELAKMNVTSDECGELSSWVAAIINNFLDVES